MTTLISWGDSSGERGRCDARCHDARSPRSECECICGGMNHGAGSTKARQNTQDLAEAWLDDMRERHGREAWASIGDAAQPSFFDAEQAC